MGLETNLAKLGISKNNVDIIIKNGFNPQRMKNNPRFVDEKDLRNLLGKII
jgi:alcohol dehydrogenase class IV